MDMVSEEYSYLKRVPSTEKIENRKQKCLIPEKLLWERKLQAHWMKEPAESPEV